jgi:hypothetical protein
VDELEVRGRARRLRVWGLARSGEPEADRAQVTHEGASVP